MFSRELIRFSKLEISSTITVDDQYYENIISSLVNECLFAIIILDGFRPNVVFEFGLLKGKNKPIIILQSTKSFINVKTLFKNIQESGLTEAEFHRLRNPRLDTSYHLSDYAGKHVTRFNTSAKLNSKEHLIHIINKEVANKYTTQIIKNVKELSTKDVSKFVPYLTTLIKFYSGIFGINISELQITYKKIKYLSTKLKITLPNDIYNILASTFLFLGIKTFDLNPRNGIKMLK